MSGRHRKPSNTARNVAAIATSGAFAAVPLLADMPPAYAGELDVNWDPIIHCESGGNPHAHNPSSTASGLFQFLDSTWSALGGTRYGRHAADATPDEQQQIADKAYSQSGLSPWAASRHCWNGKVTAGGPARHAAPGPAHAVPAAGGTGDYVVRVGDTLASIGAGHHLTWEQVWEENRAAIANPGRIYPGQHLRIDVTQGLPATPAAPVAVAPAASGAQLHIELTGYSYQDNTPPGSATVSHPVLHQQAGGTGTYDDPITVAVPNSGKGMWPAGTRFYLPTVKRYVIVEDTGASPASAGVDGHLDMWIGGQGGTKDATDACMDQITGTVAAQINPPRGLPVTPGPIYAGGCHI